MLNKIFDNIKNKIPMALIRFGDGEKNILDNIPCKRDGFSYNPSDIRDRKFRAELNASLQYYGGKNYYVGINDEELKKKVNGTVISPMVFVNQNYIEFLEKLINIAKDTPVILVVNRLSKLIKLPFSFNAFFGLDDNAWHSVNDLDKKILEYITKYNKQYLILIAGGAYSCTLIHKIWQANQNHILLDIGSTLDPFLFGQKTRKYQDRLDNDS